MSTLGDEHGSQIVWGKTAILHRDGYAQFNSITLFRGQQQIERPLRQTQDRIDNYSERYAPMVSSSLDVESERHVYSATVLWVRAGQKFLDGRYSRSHLLRFDGGIDVPASSSPNIVPVPFSAVDAVDPEEAFVASLASCHMLWFLSLSAERGYLVDAYSDSAEAVLSKNERGRWMITTVTLRPVINISGSAVPTAIEFAQLHDLAHDACYIANSVISNVHCEPTLVAST